MDPQLLFPPLGLAAVSGVRFWNGASTESVKMDPGLETAFGIKNLLVGAVSGSARAVTGNIQDNIKRKIDENDYNGKIRLEREERNNVTLLNVNKTKRVHDL